MRVADGRPEVSNEHYDLISPGRIERVIDRLPALEPYWVRVRMAYCGVCGTDHSHYTGARPANLPLSLGHEWVAVVEATGPAVRFFQRGDVVTTDLNFRCGTCFQCGSGRSHLCEQGQIGLFSNRGFAVRADIHASYLQKCSARTPVAHLALAEPLSCAMHALSLVRLSSADRVLVIGSGGIGICMAFLLCNVSGVTFDIAELDPARQCRISKVIGPHGRAVGEPSEQYDVVLDVSGTAAGLRLGCERVSPGGRLCTMSHLPETTDAQFLLTLLLHKDVTFNLSYLNGDTENLTKSIALLEQQWTPIWSSLLEVRPLTDLDGIFRDGPAAFGNKVVVDVRASYPADESETLGE